MSNMENCFVARGMRRIREHEQKVAGTQRVRLAGEAEIVTGSTDRGALRRSMFGEFLSFGKTKPTRREFAVRIS